MADWHLNLGLEDMSRYRLSVVLYAGAVIILRGTGIQLSAVCRYAWLWTHTKKWDKWSSRTLTLRGPQTAQPSLHSWASWESPELDHPHPDMQF